GRRQTIVPIPGVSGDRRVHQRPRRRHDSWYSGRPAGAVARRRTGDVSTTATAATTVVNPRSRPIRGAMIATAALIGLAAQSTPRTDAFVESMDHPAVAYTTGAVKNAVADLNDQIRRGALKLSFDPTGGYLRAVLSALRVPIDSQTLVFSQGSLQARQISP